MKSLFLNERSEKMENVVLMVSIAERRKSEAFVSFFRENGVNLTLGRYGRGTASEEMLNYLGIGDKEKCVLFSFLEMEKSKKLLKELEKKMQLKRLGTGISFTIPMSSVSGKKALEVLTGKLEEQESEGYEVETEMEAIVVITNRGYVDKVMEAARGAGANGGTVMHARGTGIEQAETFFGSTIGAEKEMIFIVAKASQRNEIMKAIKEKAGLHTEAQSVIFSLPVTDVAGFMES